MKRLTSIELLNIWETYIQLSVMEGSLYLLSALYSTDINSIAQMSIGERDARLLKFREWLFGSRLINMAHCPYCSTPIEWETNIGDLKLQDVSEIEPAKNLFLESDGFHIDFRLPNSFDIMNAMSNPVQAESISTFISGCILHVQLNQKDFKSEELPPNIIEKIDQHMAEADPQADIKMVLSCPDCNKHWEAPFDIMSYLRMEIDSWAKRLLKEVALLARAFSWSETDILNLSLHRRRLYLEMIS